MRGAPNIVLIGPMGSGKTAVGRSLARHLGRPFYDSDAEIVRRTGWADLGMAPWIAAARALPAEDAVVLDNTAPESPGRRRIVAPLFRSIANFDDFDPLRAEPEIDFAFSTPEKVPQIACDRHQFGQAMTNVLKNAAEAIEAHRHDAGPDYRGRIAVEVIADARFVTVTVSDNGVGLPSQGAERILEPYVTTREKGTGLGLAIVKKIVEEHAGEINFASQGGGGSKVTLRFARDPLAAAGVEAAA